MPTKACAQCPPCHLHGIEIRCSTRIRPKKHQIPLVRHPSNKTQNDDGAILRSFGMALYGYLEIQPNEPELYISQKAEASTTQMMPAWENSWTIETYLQ